MDSASRLLCMLGVPNRSSSAAEGELSYALSIAHIEILYCSTMKHILETILAFLTVSIAATALAQLPFSDLSCGRLCG